MAFTAKDVMKLREMTGAGMMDCKKALSETDGDMDKAVEKLRERGVAVAAKKAGRIASEGAVAAYTSADGKVAALVEVNCETDFVGKGDVFHALCDNVAMQVAKNNPVDVSSLLEEKSLSYDGTVTEQVNSVTQATGEKVAVRRFIRTEIEQGRIETYIHMGGKIGVMLTVKTGKDLSSNEEFTTACHDIAMHIAAFGPKYTYENELSADEVAKEKEILKAQIMNDPKKANKPAQIIEKMLEGGLAKMYKEVCLINQDFVKDPSVTIAGLLAKIAKANDTEISIVKFDRYVMGEGLEKKNEDFAEEIAKLSAK